MNSFANAKGRLFAALEGCYEAPRAAALSGVPVSTVYDWARKGIVVPIISSAIPKDWSYADLMTLRIVYWLRHPKPGELGKIPASPMEEVRRALRELERLNVDIWDENLSKSTSLQVDPSGKVHIVTKEFVKTSGRRTVMGEALDLLGPFNLQGNQGPDLRRPRPLLRIIPGKVSGEPHLLDSRITTKAIAALYRRFGDVRTVSTLYPDQRMQSVTEAIELELSLSV